MYLYLLISTWNQLYSIQAAIFFGIPADLGLDIFRQINSLKTRFVHVHKMGWNHAIENEKILV